MELIQQYSMTTIFQVTVLLALTTKGCVSFFEWLFPKVKRLVKKVDEPRIIKKDLREQTEEINEIKESIQELAKKIDILIDSDKDAIKAFITREHHYYVYHHGWIDDYMLDCIQKRYSHYLCEGGNSFIKGLMEEIRKLPKKPQQKDLQS